MCNFGKKPKPERIGRKGGNEGGKEGGNEGGNRGMREFQDAGYLCS